MKSHSKPYSEELIRRTETKKSKSEVNNITPLAQNYWLLKHKPKIPKSGKSLYKGFYIRTKDKFEHIHHIESGLYVVSVEANARQWIDERYNEIMERINEVMEI